MKHDAAYSCNVAHGSRRRPEPSETQEDTAVVVSGRHDASAHLEICRLDQVHLSHCRYLHITSSIPCTPTHITGDKPLHLLHPLSGLMAVFCVAPLPFAASSFLLDGILLCGAPSPLLRPLSGLMEVFLCCAPPLCCIFFTLMAFCYAVPPPFAASSIWLDGSVLCCAPPICCTLFLA